MTEHAVISPSVLVNNKPAVSLAEVNRLCPEPASSISSEAPPSPLPPPSSLSSDLFTHPLLSSPSPPRVSHSPPVPLPSFPDPSALSEHADRAIHELAGRQLAGRSIKLEHAKKRAPLADRLTSRQQRKGEGQAGRRIGVEAWKQECRQVGG